MSLRGNVHSFVRPVLYFPVIKQQEHLHHTRTWPLTATPTGMDVDSSLGELDGLYRESDDAVATDKLKVQNKVASDIAQVIRDIAVIAARIKASSSTFFAPVSDDSASDNASTTTTEEGQSTRAVKSRLRSLKPKALPIKRIITEARELKRAMDISSVPDEEIPQNLEQTEDRFVRCEEINEKLRSRISQERASAEGVVKEHVGQIIAFIMQIYEELKGLAEKPVEDPMKQRNDLDECLEVASDACSHFSELMYGKARALNKSTICAAASVIDASVDTCLLTAVPVPGQEARPPEEKFYTEITRQFKLHSCSSSLVGASRF